MAVPYNCWTRRYKLFLFHSLVHYGTKLVLPFELQRVAGGNHVVPAIGQQETTSPSLQHCSPSQADAALPGASQRGEEHVQSCSVGKDHSDVAVCGGRESSKARDVDTLKLLRRGRSNVGDILVAKRKLAEK